MRRVLPLVMSLVACSSGDAPVGDTDTDAAPTGETADTGAPTDTDTDAPAPCGAGEPVEVVVTADKGWYVRDADVRWHVEDGRSGACELPEDGWDRWSCPAPLEGDLLVTATHPWLRGYADVLRAGVDGCRDGGEVLDGSGTLSPAGAHFAEDRVYAFRRYEDDDTCEHAFELYGQSCWSTAMFCADGHSVVLNTDILNEGVYRLEPDGTLLNHLLPEGDVPKDTTWTFVDEGTFRAWDQTTWVRKEGVGFPAWACDGWFPIDTGGFDTSTPDSDSDVDTDSDSDVDTDVAP